MANRKNTFLLKRSNVAGKVPAAGDLQLGELAINTADAILYVSGTTSNSILPIGWDRVARTGDTVTGNFNFVGDMTINGSSLPSGYALSVTGDTNFVGDVYVRGDLSYSGSVFVTGSTIIQSGLTANTIYTDYIDLNTNYTGATTQGRLSWDSGTGTLNIGVGDVGGTLIDLQVGQEEIVRVFNAEATTLQRGEIVYVFSSQGNRPSVKRAIATSDGYSVTTLGMVTSDVTSGSEGYVTTFGIISNLNTNGLSGGTAIWLSPTIAGGYTATKPQAPYHTVLIGYVVRVDATVGSVFVNISNGWEIDELHDVRINGKTSGDLLTLSAYNGTDVWVNSKTLNGSYTITGDTTVGNQMKAVSVSATTYYNLPIDITVTGGTYLDGTATFTNNTGGTFTVTGFSTGSSTFSGGTITGPTNFISGLTANTITTPSISATTYLGLPTDITVTGATYSNNTFTFTNNTGGTFNVLFNTVTGLTSTSISATSITADTVTTFIPEMSPYEIYRGVTFQNNSTTVTTYGGVVMGTTASNLAQSVTSTNFVSKQIRLRYYASVVSTGRYTGTRGSALLWFIGGGFRYICDFNISDTAFASTCQQFYGLAGQTSDLAYGGVGLTQVSTLTNLIGLGNDGADTNLQIIHNDSGGTATKIDLGVNFPANRTAGSTSTTVYSLTLYNAPASNDVKYIVVNNETGAVVMGVITTNLPSPTQGLNFFASRAMGGGGGVTNSGQFDLLKLGVNSLL
jgi:hypothetical protein